MSPAAATLPDLDWPLMAENITREDLDTLIDYLRQDSPRMTQGPQVAAFEREWSEWLGVRHSLFVNSGSSANLLTLAALRALHGPGGEVIVPPLTWVSDIAAVLHLGFTPVFTDIRLDTLALDPARVAERLGPRTRAVFLTHVLGYNGLEDSLVDLLRARGIPLIEDVCESHGATWNGKRLGSIGWASNFSYYFAHHLSTIEGGMVCTDDDRLYQTLRMLRSHGMTREADDPAFRDDWSRRHPDLKPSFIFAHEAFNVRSTELNAVIGRNGLKRLDHNNRLRREHLDLFLDRLDPQKFHTGFRRDGSSNYALTLLLRQPDPALRDRVEAALDTMRVEYRRGMSGGGNQLRQPYLRRHGIVWEPEAFPNIEHVHFYGYYLGNYPSLHRDKIHRLCDILNDL